MKTADRIVRNTGILYLRMAITVVVSLYTTRVTLNALGVGDFGLFNLVAGAISMLTFLNAAMASATQRFMSFAEGAGNLNTLKSIFNVSVVLHIAIAFILLLILEISGYFLFNGILTIPESRLAIAKIIFQLMIISTLFSVVSVPYDAVINAHENMLLLAVLGVVEVVSKFFIAMSLLYTNHDKLLLYGILIVILSIFLLLIRRIYCNKAYAECEINLRENFNKNVFKEMASFASWSFLGSSSSVIANYGQGLIMNIFFGPLVNTAQGIANQISGQLGVFAVNMLKALNPIINKSEGAGNRKLMLKASFLGSKMSFFLLLMFYIPVIIEMPFIFKQWLGVIPDYSVIFCRLLLVRNLIEQFYITISTSISAVGNIKNFQIVKSILSIFALMISFLLFSNKLPPQTIYIVFIVYALFDLITVLLFAKKYCELEITIYLKTIIAPCIIISAVVFLISKIPTLYMVENFVRLISVSMISFLLLIVGIWCLGLNLTEKNVFRSIIIKASRKLSITNN